MAHVFCEPTEFCWTMKLLAVLAKFFQVLASKICWNILLSTFHIIPEFFTARIQSSPCVSLSFLDTELVQLGKFATQICTLLVALQFLKNIKNYNSAPKNSFS